MIREQNFESTNKIDLIKRVKECFESSSGKQQSQSILNGEVDVETPFGITTLSVDETGEIDVEF